MSNISSGMLIAIFFDALLFVYCLLYYTVAFRSGAGRLGSRLRVAPPVARPRVRPLRERIEAICLSMDRWTGQPSKGHPEIQARLVQAGLRSAAAPAVFYSLTVALAVLLPALLTLYLLGVVGAARNTLLIPLIAAGVGFVLPRLLLRAKVTRRQEALRLALPQALDLMVVGVEAGFGLDACLQRVSAELGRSYPELSEELRQLLFELRNGIRRRAAFRHLMDRTGLDEIGSLVAALIQADEQGGNLALALRGYAGELRTRRRQAAEERAAKIPVQLTFPIFFFIFPALFIVVGAPAMIRLVRELLPRLRP